MSPVLPTMEVLRKLRRVWRFIGVRIELFIAEDVNFHVAEGNHAPVFLQKNIAVRPFAKTRYCVKFAVGNQLAEIRRAALILHDFDAVQPMLYMIAFYHDISVIPFADVVWPFIR